MHRARKIGRGFFTNPKGFNSVAKSSGSGGSAAKLAGKRGVFLPAVAGREGGDEAEITDEFCFSGRAKGGHQRADHRIGSIAEFCGHFGHAGAHGRRDTGTSTQSQRDRDLGHATPFGD